MSLRTIVKNRLKTIDKVTKSLQAEVQYKPWIARDGYGSPTYGAIKKYRAVVDEGNQPRVLPSGLQMITKAYIVILEPIPPNGAAGRVEPIDDRDIFILPSGLKATVAATRGFTDSVTTYPYFMEVWLGERSTGDRS